MPAVPKLMTIKLHLLLDPATSKMLEEICTATGHTKAMTVRSLIVARYSHLIMGHPTCSTGQRCYVPQMFNANPPANYPAPQPRFGPSPEDTAVRLLPGMNTNI